MERLVLELKNLNFQQLNNSENVDKKKTNCGRAYNSKQRFSRMSDEQGAQQLPNVTPNTDDEENFASVSKSSIEISEEELEIDVIDAKKTENFKARGGVNFRKLPQRAAKADSLHSKNLRTPMKPPKLSPKTTEKLGPAQIEKLYKNKKITNFRPSSLETIFEEPQPSREGEQFRLVGAKKLRRALVCSDGLKPSKTIVNRRRAKIKKKLGRRCTWKKIPIQNFLNYMQNSLSLENEDDGGTCDKLETTDAFIKPLKAVNENENFKMDLADESENTSKT